MTVNRTITESIIWATCLVGFASCTTEHRNKYEAPRFEEVLSASFELLTEDQPWGGTSKIYKYGDVLAVVTSEPGYSEKPGTWLHLFDLDGNRLSNLIAYGRGPFDAGTIIRADLKENLLYMLDYSGSKLLTVNMATVVADGYGAVDSFDIQQENRLASHFVLPGGNVLRIHNPSFNEPDSLYRIQLYSQDGTLLCKDDQSPYSECDAKTRFYFEAVSSRQAISPDGRHLAIAIGAGAILEIYTIENRSVSDVVTKNFIKPELARTPDGVSISEKTVAGFNYLFPTDGLLYAAYDGESFFGKSSPVFKNIAVFDWEGKALKEIRTDHRIESLCTENGKEFYAVVNDAEGRAFIAKLII